MNFAPIWCIPNPTPARRVTHLETFTCKLWTRLRGSPGLADRATHLGGSPQLSCKRDPSKMRDFMDRWVTPLKRVASPTWGPPFPCKQALTDRFRLTRKWRRSKSEIYIPRQIDLQLFPPLLGPKERTLNLTPYTVRPVALVWHVFWKWPFDRGEDNKK